MAWNNFIRVSKRQTRKVLTLYTINGCTQEQIGAQVFPAGVERKLSRTVLTRRVLHVFGLGMRNRSAFHQEGLTPAVIEEILSNPLLPFPLLIPPDREPEGMISFNAEVSRQINGEGRYSAAYGIFQNVLALLAIAAIQAAGFLLGSSGAVLCAPLMIYCAVSLLVEARDEERNDKRRGGVLIMVLLFLFMAWMAWMSRS
ncbi:hypothetical protein [uncultured Oscillibacter sp.]|uniref:hypothetical protein n=1 Tax=uncultured Oscillibacter sp. TaxID=876091 RepID=UPI00262B7E9B|nr:hypothetical protein [uncultured Oscillibacter sp.]